MEPTEFTFLCRTKTSFGKSALDHLPFDLSSMGAHKPFVLQDNQAAESHCTRPLIQAFKESEMTLGIYPALDRERSVDMETLKNCYQLFTDRGFDSIIALGGKQVVNLAKILNMAVSWGPEALETSHEHTVVAPPLMPFAYVPTTVGAGRETDCTAIFNGKRFNLPGLPPDIALIDQSMMARDTLNNIANAALTSLAVSCETLALSKNPPARAYAATAVGLVMTHLFALIHKDTYSDTAIFPNDKEDRYHLSCLVHASAITGYLIANVHPLIGFKMGSALPKSCFAFPGKAMLVVLPAVLEIFSNTESDMDLLLLNLLGQDEFCTIPSSQHGVTAIQTLRNILNTLYGLSKGAIPRTLEDAGMNSEKMDTYFKAVCQQEINVDPDKIKAILTHSFDGHPMAQG
ncbi:MAG: iron-containing alcohol dehydrogenase [Desulfobacterium sp.]